VAAPEFELLHVCFKPDEKASQPVATPAYQACKQTHHTSSPPPTMVNDLREKSKICCIPRYIIIQSRVASAEIQPIKCPASAEEHSPVWSYSHYPLHQERLPWLSLLEIDYYALGALYNMFPI
jgi:hypothetical protein